MLRSIKDIKKPLIAITLLMLVTGLAYVILDNFFEIQTEFGMDHHPAQKWFLKIHGIGSAVFIFLFGMTYVLHIQRTFQEPERRRSGWINLIFWTLLIVSGYSLLYFAADSIREYLSYFHWILGCFTVLIFYFHSRKLKVPKSGTADDRRHRRKPRG